MKNSANILLSLVALCLLSLTSATANAHGSDYPLYGGIVEVVGDTSFELVVEDDRVELYVVEEGLEIDASTRTAKLMVKTNGERSEIALEPAEGNSFVALDVSIPKGSEVSVVLKNNETQAKIGAKFTIE